MKLAECIARSAKDSILAKTDVAGYFDFTSLAVWFTSLSSEDLTRWDEVKRVILHSKLDYDAYQRMMKVLPLAHHEYTHFIDGTSSIWGLQHLQKMERAYWSAHTFDETTFRFAKEFHDHTRRIRLPEYYTQQFAAENVYPWGWGMTIGRVFDSAGVPSQHPILFARFSNRHGQQLVRSPVSTVSILECSAMSQELLCTAWLVNSCHEDFMYVERAHLSERLLQYLYNPEITEYSVCVHIVANFQKCKDIGDAFRLSAIISRLVLNATPSVFGRILELGPIENILGYSDHNLIQPLKAGLKVHDMGILFYLIVRALPEGAFSSEEAAIAGVETSIRTLGIPLEDWVTEVKSESKKLIQELSKSQIAPLAKIASAGYENLHRIPLTSTALKLTELNTPPALLNDDKIISMFWTDKNSLREFDVARCYDELSDGDAWVRKLASACV